VSVAPSFILASLLRVYPPPPPQPFFTVY
jgi:hypothetical protein